MNSNPLRRCWVEIDSDALRHNVSVLRAHAGRDIGVMAVVKADAYGHGLAEVSRILAESVDWFCVANVSEALEIVASIQTGKPIPRILILSPSLPDEYQQLIDHGFSASVSSLLEVENFGAAAAELGKVINLHAVVDTGMGRMGVAPNTWLELLDKINTHPHCNLEGVSSHFPNADCNPEFTQRQIQQFKSMVSGLDCEIHIANSAGLIDFTQDTDYVTMFRPGLAVYGVSPECKSTLDLRPALTMKSRVTLIRPIESGDTISYGSTFVAQKSMSVATVAVGYGDGYPRHLSGKAASVLIKGSKCPVLGRVTMDQIVVDVTHLPQLKVGEEVVLIGQQNHDYISVTEVAQKADTIPWEIFTGITNRVERLYR